MDSLTYQGDCTDYPADHFVGPDRAGAFYRPMSAEFDGEKTRIDYLPIPPADLPVIADDKLRQAEDRVRIAELLGGRPW